ncbi:MAG TPA: methyltransferase domain-containing protein [Acidobacteriaceae bacterium]|jgi:SAM-dependent methyltransferase
MLKLIEALAPTLIQRNSMVTTEDVRAAYRLILGREPENEEVLEDCARQSDSLEDLRETFLHSAEFANSWSHSARKALHSPPIEVEVEATGEKLSIMMRHIEANWHHLGISDPHWSVITHDAFRASNILHTEKRFYESGKYDVETLQRTAERCGTSLTGFNRCLELGCGVGRMTIWLAGLFERIVAADISQAHLALAREALDRFERGNADIIHLASFESLETLPQFDVFFSVIVLQHNPPPLIVLLLKTLLNKLQPGGIAYFQVPTYRPGYRFRVDEYLRSASPTGGMEMHLLPQHVLFDVLQQSGCRILECWEDFCTGDRQTISNSIFARKQLAVA